MFDRMWSKLPLKLRSAVRKITNRFGRSLVWAASTVVAAIHVHKAWIEAIRAPIDLTRLAEDLSIIISPERSADVELAFTVGWCALEVGISAFLKYFVNTPIAALVLIVSAYETIHHGKRALTFLRRWWRATKRRE